jgi:hypothetical protein
VVVGVATITATLVFSASLARVFTDPRLYGWNWDLQIGDPFSPSLEGEAARLATDPSLAAVASATVLRLDFAGRSVDTIGIASLKGEVEPTVVDGRAPERDDEVLLGKRTSEALGVGLGDRLDLRAGDVTRRFEVVGTGVLPAFAGAAQLGEGAAMTLDGARRLAPRVDADVVLVRATPGLRAGATIDRLAQGAGANVYRPTKPFDLAALERLGGLPALVAVTLGDGRGHGDPGLPRARAEPSPRPGGAQGRRLPAA